jgi:hypothetical protein
MKLRRVVRSRWFGFVILVSDAEQPISASVAPSEPLDAVILDAEVPVEVRLVGKSVELLSVVRFQGAVHYVLRGVGAARNFMGLEPPRPDTCDAAGARAMRLDARRRRNVCGWQDTDTCLMGSAPFAAGCGLPLGQLSVFETSEECGAAREGEAFRQWVPEAGCD